ncbi:MAG: radical SAM protein, partial [Dethiosulfatibacter sp.]|nr:radical SAM protein [Dethiosulfatibacter sp.]
MNNKNFIDRNIDGSLVIPEYLLNSTPLKNHSELMVIEEDGRLILVPSIHSLSRLYVEPTSTCNLNCVTCIRSNWHEESGFMDMTVFHTLIEQVRDFKTIGSVMFSGFGEPLSHPHILDMIKAFSDLGLNTEVTTNGTLLDDDMVDGLFDAGLNDLWVSIDSVTPNKFNEIREGGDFDQVYQNLKK